MSSSLSISSTSSFLTSLAQAWNQQLTSRDRQIAHEESREAITHDSITYLPFTEPLSDPCGHTFDRETIKGFKKLPGGKLECPVSRRAYTVDQFHPNLYAENVLGYFGEEASRANHAFSRVCPCTTCATNSSSSASSSTAMSSTSSGSTTSTSTNSEPTLTDVMRELTLIGQDVQHLRRTTALQHRQITNLVSMSCCDKFKSMIICSHLQTVRDRGFTNEEMEFLSS